MRNIMLRSGRFKAIRIVNVLLIDLMTTGKELLPGKCTDGLPAGAQIEYVYSINLQETGVIVSHHDFDEIAVTQDIPEILLTYERTWKELEEKPVVFREFL